MSSDFDAKIREVEAGVLYWPILLEMQRRRLAVTVVAERESLLPKLDFVAIMREVGLASGDAAVASLRKFEEPEELVSRYGKRLWYWVKHENGIARLLLVCLREKAQAEAKEILRVDEEDAQYLIDASQLLNRAVELTSYSVDVLYRVVQHWAWMHNSSRIGDWEAFDKEDIRISLEEVVAFIGTLKKTTTATGVVRASVEFQAAQTSELAAAVDDAEKVVEESPLPSEPLRINKTVEVAAAVDDSDDFLDEAENGQDADAVDFREVDRMKRTEELKLDNVLQRFFGEGAVSESAETEVVEPVEDSSTLN